MRGEEPGFRTCFVGARDACPDASSATALASDVLAWLAAAAAIIWGTDADDGIRDEGDTFFLVPAAMFVFLAIFPVQRGRAWAFGVMAAFFAALYVVCPAFAGNAGEALSLPPGFQVSYWSTVARLALASCADRLEAGGESASKLSEGEPVRCWCGEMHRVREQRLRRRTLR